MLVLPIDEIRPFSMPQHKKEASSARSLYEVIRALFRACAMAVQYAAVWTSIFCRHWRWLPSAIHSRHLKVCSRNIGSLKSLKICLKTALHPISKEEYAHVGRSAGLRVANDLIYRPANGLCLGTALTFLSRVLPVDDQTEESIFLSAGQTLKQDHDETIIKVQAVYDALIGVAVAVPQQEINLFRRMLQGIVFTLKKENSHHPLMESIEAYLQLEDPLETLRQYVLDDLENKGEEITPKLYALALEVDAAWQLLKQPDETKYLSVHHAIIQTAANLVNLRLRHAVRHEGEIDVVSEELESLAKGGYLVQFRDHTVALVKTSRLLVLFDPSEGLGLAPIEDQGEAIVQLLNFYGSNDRASVKIIPVQMAGENHDDG